MLWPSNRLPWRRLDGEKFQVVTVEIKASRKPQGLPEFTREVANNPGAQTAGVAAAETYLGLSEAEAIALIGLATVIFNHVIKKPGEDIYGEIGFSDDYSVCRVLKADEVSRGCSSSLDTNIGGADGHRLSYYMHVPEADMTANTTCWIGAKFMILGVKKSEKSSVNCSENNARVLSCPTGSSCDHGPGVEKL